MFKTSLKVILLTSMLSSILCIAYYFYAVFTATDMFTLVKSFMQFIMMIFAVSIIVRESDKL